MSDSGNYESSYGYDYNNSSDTGMMPGMMYPGGSARFNENTGQYGPSPMDDSSSGMMPGMVYTGGSARFDENTGT
ncbi:unnamed protein product, partial [Rotaria sp. Silwood1]